MKRFPNTQGDLLVIERGEEVHARLMDYTKTAQLQSGWLSGLGGASSVTLGFYNIATRQYEWTTFEEPLEIVNLTGNLAWIDGEPFWHIHGTFSGQDLRAISGHVKELVIGLTGELLITPLETPLTRRYDDATGLKLLGTKQE